MARRCETLTEIGGWHGVPFKDLQPGQVFRLFEPDGTPVMDAEGAWRWRVLGVGAPDAEGRPTVEAEPILESEAEQLVRRDGVYWPGSREGG